MFVRVTEILAGKKEAQTRVNVNLIWKVTEPSSLMEGTGIFLHFVSTDGGKSGRPTTMSVKEKPEYFDTLGEIVIKGEDLVQSIIPDHGDIDIGNNDSWVSPYSAPYIEDVLYDKHSDNAD